VLDLLGRAAQPALYENAPSSSPVARLLITALFLGQSSLTAVKYFSNGPMWSMPYELWYYALFGAARYLRGALRAILLVVLAVVAGHKILLLLPVWALGLGVRYLHRTQRVPPRRSRRLGLVLAILVFVCCCEYPPLIAWLYRINAAAAEPLLERGVALEFSSWFVRDLVVGLAVACALWLMNDGLPGPARGWGAAAVRAIASRSFSIYLFHVPLLLALRASGLAATDTLLGASALGAITLATCAGLAHVSEHRLGFYRRAVGRAATLAASALRRGR
jgi:peptidoglycan/LPS O-acetylase OafA/YrhL